MSILDLIQEVTMAGYSATEDVADGFENLEDGTYEGYVSDFYHKENDKGTEWFGFEITIPSENNRKYWGNLFLAKKMAVVNFKKTLNYIYKMSDVEMQATDFADIETGVETAKNAVVGAQVLLTLKTNKNDFQTFNLEVTEKAQQQ